MGRPGSTHLHPAGTCCTTDHLPLLADRRTRGRTTTTDTCSQHNPGKSQGRPKDKPALEAHRPKRPARLRSPRRPLSRINRPYARDRTEPSAGFSCPDEQARWSRLLLLTKAAVLGRRLDRRLAAGLDDTEQRIEQSDRRPSGCSFEARYWSGIESHRCSVSDAIAGAVGPGRPRVDCADRRVRFHEPEEGDVAGIPRRPRTVQQGFALPAGRRNLGITSVYLQGIDNGEIIETVHARLAPMIPVSATLRL